MFQRLRRIHGVPRNHPLHFRHLYLILIRDVRQVVVVILYFHNVALGIQRRRTSIKFNNPRVLPGTRTKLRFRSHTVREVPEQTSRRYQLILTIRHFVPVRRVRNLELSALIPQIRNVTRHRHLNNRCPFNVQFPGVVFRRNRYQGLTKIRFIHPLTGHTLMNHQEQRKLKHRRQVNRLHRVLALRVTGRVIVVREPCTMTYLAGHFPLREVLNSSTYVVLRAINRSNG